MQSLLLHPDSERGEGGGKEETDAGGKPCVFSEGYDKGLAFKSMIITNVGTGYTSVIEEL